tara:strand:+ start:168 stop:389 length:222 start_codon:yes stop_codon:yes gene_type:complete
MDKTTFDKKIHKAKERLHQMLDVSRQQKIEGDMMEKSYIEERLITWALLNMSDKEFNQQIRQVEAKNKTLYKS